ncbi:iron-sulfur cluster assembly scaffold protein [Parvularcula oceani]|uniref:iron-sulfur cluster assembly scaffold protein n=1 Tax=Parvularcula oceani TaxID=1247963 RepID=UPI0004E1B7F3|nr:iron-sulfur cluster assembly scaffold protein [Parvularcula oceani]
MLDDLYSGALLEAAGSIPPARSLPDADATSRKTSKVCGSVVELDLSLRDGVVDDLAMRVKACALGQAAASMLGRTAKGATPQELRILRDEMEAMLKRGGPPPSSPRFAEMEKLAPVAAYPARHASVMLPFEAAADCLGQIEARAAR